MSVTFAIDAVPTGAFTGECWADGEPVEAFRAESYDDALLAITRHRMGCPECDAYGIYATPVMDVDSDDLAVNVANINARTLGPILGVDLGEDLCGSMDAAAFRSAVLGAMAGQHSPIEPYAGGASIFGGGARVIDCGFDADNYLLPLLALSTEAARLGREVTWG